MSPKFSEAQLEENRVSKNADINYRTPVLRLLQSARDMELNTTHLLQRAGIHTEIATRPNLQVRNRHFINLLLLMSSELQDEFYGMASRRLKKGSLAMMTDIALHSKNLEGALEGIHRFIEIVTDDFEVNLTQHNAIAQVELVQRNQQTDPEFFLSDYWLFYLHRLSSWLIGYLIPITSIAFMGPPSEREKEARFIDLLATDWRGGSDRNLLTFSSKYLAMPVVRSKVEWLQHVENVRGGMFSWPNSDKSATNKVKRVIFEQLNVKHSTPSLQTVAQNLAMSPQTLRRRLREEGSSFQRLLDQLRCDLAIEALYLQHLSVEKASQMLGFSEVRSFSRAFKKWTGMPPTEYLHRAHIEADKSTN